jgi:hypothetical protein
VVQGELFPLPPGVRVSAPQRRRWPDQRPSYTPCQPRRRTLCHDCVRLIHQHGQQGAPYPATVRWRRKAGADVALLCEAHKRERQESDG